ncbi:MAG TPA: Gfo/Idh/MocA family oxidoreductase [Gammaproteobacteria bacterium]|nr:Gfo/Idh/MocA family oxidoreductase [Gammaproteobacteria bacterium]
MEKIRTAVVGTGYLGRYHAQKYAVLPGSQLVAVCDSNTAVARSVARELGTEGITDYRQLAGKVDAVSIVVPTQQHHGVARWFLENGVHVLLEKPIAASVAEARELVESAAEHGRILQIGHLERFNPAILAAESVVDEPRFIESHRLAPFNPRGADVNVVLDLMIHDIDIILDMVRSPVRQLDASGVAVLSSDIDIANVRLQFANGCVANVTASRASARTERKMRLFQHDSYIAIDFHNKQLEICRKGATEQHPGIPDIESERHSFEQGDALLSEIGSFLQAIRRGHPPVVSGEDGLRALETALAISEQLKQGVPAA